MLTGGPLASRGLHKSILDGCPQSGQEVGLLCLGQNLIGPLVRPLADRFLGLQSCLFQPQSRLLMSAFQLNESLESLLTTTQRPKRCSTILSQLRIQVVLVPNAQLIITQETRHCVNVHSSKGVVSLFLMAMYPFLEVEPRFEILDTPSECRFVPQDPTAQCSGRRRVSPVLSHSPVSPQVAGSPSHILVLRKVRIPLLTKGSNNLTPIALHKHCIVLLLWFVTLANRLQRQSTTCLHSCLHA